jgi:hypothetical protein
MSIFDLIPTIGEVIDKTACILTDHNWVRLDGGKVVCADCGAVKK